MLGAGGAAAWLRFANRSGARRARIAAPTTTTTTPPTSPTVLPDGMDVPTAGWVIAENSQPGTGDWVVAGSKIVPHGIEGYANQVSAVSGDTVELYVNCKDPTFHVEAYRMGWYGGYGGRLIWQSAEATGVQQPEPVFTDGINMVECQWNPSVEVPITDAWPPGAYLLKLVGSGYQQQWVPLCVRDDASTAAFAIMDAVTTWQAYNLWGSYSLYYGQAGAGQDYDNRSRVVSFDRPYPLDWANGAADFIGNELPLVLLMEKYGLDVTYMTDIDLHVNPQLVQNHSALLSLGHDEYWSLQMRQGATDALNAGVNLVFFGANACYRRIRLQPSAVGDYRQQICYKTDYEDDPLYGVDDAQVTANWPDAPAADPESSLIGSMYQSNPVNADLVITEPTSWLYNGLEAYAGASLSSVVGTEYDRYQPGSTSPDNVEILAHSPLVCQGVSDHSDITWYTTQSGGGVLATGTNWWISKLTDTSYIPPILLPGPFPGVTPAITQMTLNILSAVGNGPAGRQYPSQPNWDKYYPGYYSTALSSGDQAA